MSSDTQPTKLYTALLAAQRAMGPVLKDAKNPAFRSSYATLQSVLDTIEGPLWDNGLVIVQRFQYDRIGRDAVAGEGTPILITELIHAASGDKLESVVPVVCKDPNDPQKVGGALTYYRRYSLLALLNLAPDDDDGNSASKPPSPRQQPAHSGNGANAVKDQAGIGPFDRDVQPAPRQQSPRPAPPTATGQAQHAPAPGGMVPADLDTLLNDASRMHNEGTPYAAVVDYLRPYRPEMSDRQYERVLTFLDAIKPAKKPAPVAPASSAG